MNVTKRDGTVESIDLDKIHKVVEWGCEGLENVSVSEIELKAHIQMFDGIETSVIHELLIRSAADLISVETPDYQYVAARLAIFHMRKVVFGGYTPPDLNYFIKHMVAKGLYDADLLNLFTDEERLELDLAIQHDNDLNFAYAAIQQWEGKYLVQDRVTKQLYETPQFAYMAISMVFFQSEDASIRMQLIKEMYKELTEGRISLPTPIMGGLRTPTRQFSSCVVIESGDSLDSINAASNAIVKYVSQRAGIGINFGRIRALGSKIRKGEAKHTGVIPFLKLFQAAVKSCSQGALRGGAATAFYPIWHLEVQSLLVLKNNRGVEENRVRNLDYGVQLNKLMYQRLLTKGNITLFSPSDVPGLYEAFFADQELFEQLYTKYEADDSIRKESVSAVELFSTLLQERAQTGRIYIMNVDHANTHSSFTDTIRQSNLCMEISLPTTEMGFDSDEPEIALCTLAAFNLGVSDLDNRIERSAYLIVRALDNLLDYQDYPMKAAEKAKLRRSLGIGVTNYAYWLAKNGLFYSNGSANNATHRLFESIQFSLLKASMQLAEEKGACGMFDRTKYAKGLLPIDHYKKEVDDVHTQALLKDWEWLRGEIAKHGLRNSTLTAQMPCETSSQITNSTNGIEPPRGLVSVKASKDGVFKQVVPESNTLFYELLWDIPSNQGYLELNAIMQKFIDQSISTNTNYDPEKFADGKVPITQLIKDLVLAYKLGIKTLYYHNTRDGSGDAQQDDGCASGACKL
jgi:ribonucleoside-diphosphate reductase alpha chain